MQVFMPFDGDDGDAVAFGKAIKMARETTMESLVAGSPVALISASRKNGPPATKATPTKAPPGVTTPKVAGANGKERFGNATTPAKATGQSTPASIEQCRGSPSRPS